MSGAKALIFVHINDQKIWGCSHSSVAKSVAHSTPCVINILFNDIYTSHATQKPENHEEILENLRFSIQSHQERLSEIRLRERRMTQLLTSYAFDRCGGVLNASLRVA